MILYKIRIDKKIFTLILLALLFVLTGILSPLIIKIYKNNWEVEVKEKVKKDEEIVLNSFNQKVENLINESINIKRKIHSALKKGNLFELLNTFHEREDYPFNIQLYNSNMFTEDGLIFWNSERIVPHKNLLEINNSFNQIYFYDGDLIIYLSFVDTLLSSKGKYYLFVDLPLEKKYRLRKENTKYLSWSDSLSQILNTTVEIKYDVDAKPSKDGRFHSFFLLNNNNYKIGVVNLEKPAFDNVLNELNGVFKNIQYLILLLIYFNLIWIVIPHLKKIYKKIYRFLSYLLIIVILRLLLFYSGFPSSYLRSPLTDPSYFSSTFAFGMVRSPLEFTITSLMGLVIIFIGFKYTIDYYDSKRNYLIQQTSLKNQNYLCFILITIISFLLLLLSLRGLGASLRSVIFDSSIRYFKEFNLIPDAPTFLMDFNILVLGVSVIILSLILLLFVFSFKTQKSKQASVKLFVILFIFLQIAGWIFDAVQKQPQGTPAIRVLYILIIFILAYLLIFNNYRSIIKYIFIAFGASIATVSLLTFYNSEIERESLKTTAQELTRSNQSIYQFMVYQTLSEIEKEFQRTNLTFQTSLTGHTDLRSKNLSAVAFTEWTKSLLYNEAVPSFINFYNNEKKLIGSFSTSTLTSNMFDRSNIFNNLSANKHDKLINSINSDSSTGQTGLTAQTSMKISIIPEIFGLGKIIKGIIPLKENNNIIGYAEVGVLFDESNFGFTNVQKYFLTERGGISSAINLERMKMFYIINDKVVKSFGLQNLTGNEIKYFINAPFTKYNEAWLNLSIGGEKYLFYCLKLINKEENDESNSFDNSNQFDSTKILAVGKEEKNFTWKLSDFFKVFFIHTLIILASIIIVSLWNYSRLVSFMQSYSTKLGVTFIIVSIIPIIVFTIYFKNIIETKNAELLSKRLSELAHQIDNYIKVYNSKSSVKPEFIYDKASEDLGIKFSVFKDKSLEYSTNQNLYEVGLLSKIISPKAYEDLLLKGLDKSFITFQSNMTNQTRLTSQNYNSVFLRASFNSFDNKPCFIEVNDLFNEILIPLSDVELDIFMFGIFSLAVITIIIFSTVLANQISYPIRKLTLATRSVGSGDLNVEVTGKYSGEIAELTSGFNMMVQKLKKGQLELAQLEREAAWKEMAKQVAHEIKNPLTPMKLSIQQLIAAYNDKSPKFNDIFNKVTSTIINQIEVLKNIASEFSNFARMPKLNIEKINVVDVLKESVNLFANEKLSIKLMTDRKEIVVYADYDHLNRTFINLIRNSIQANAQNISINITIEDNVCQMRFIDDGIGIPNEHIERIFDENFTTKEYGMGLGLSMAKRFLESINGSIAVESTSEKGTTFLIKIPLA